MILKLWFLQLSQVGTASEQVTTGPNEILSLFITSSHVILILQNVEGLSATTKPIVHGAYLGSACNR